MPQPASAAITMLDGADPGVRRPAQHRGKPRVDDVVEARRDVDTEIGAAEDDAVVSRRRPEGQVDALPGMQADADAADRRLQRLLAATWSARGPVDRGRSSMYRRSVLLSQPMLGKVVAGREPWPVNVCF